jgi:hypothetical protein
VAARAPSSIDVRPIQDWGPVIQLAAEAGSDTKRLVPAELSSINDVNGCRDLVMGGLEAIASGKFGENGYHGVTPNEAAGLRSYLSILVFVEK